MGCLATLGLTAGVASAQDVDRDAIAERLAPVGELCLQGEECGTQAAQAQSGGNGGGGGGDVDGAAIYNQVCMACHETGAAGAPVRGDEGAWADRADKGFATLLDHAINGFNAMPARGGNPNLSDAEVEAAVVHLVEPVMEVPATGGEAQAASEEPAAPQEEAAAEEATASEEEAPATEEPAATEEATAASEEEAAAEGDAPSHAGIDGEAIYNQACMACHMTGAAGAPIRGNAEQWGPRVEKGIDTLYDHAINGFNAMPAKGGNMSLSDDEVKAAVDYIVEPVQ
ncbi:cytochrome c5 family protein [Billgrantia azerbaijanica]|nr:cytochrome c5 family protein [Halomonas azerbaijanica]